MKIWKLLASPRRYYSTSGGGQRTYDLALQDWGLDVNTINFIAEITAASGTNAKFGLQHDEFATSDLHGKRTQGTPISSAVVSGNYPETRQGSSSGARAPIFQPVVIVDSADANEQWVEVAIWGGGSEWS